MNAVFIEVLECQDLINMFPADPHCSQKDQHNHHDSEEDHFKRQDLLEGMHMSLVLYHLCLVKVLVLLMLLLNLFLLLGLLDFTQSLVRCRRHANL